MQTIVVSHHIHDLTLLKAAESQADGYLLDQRHLRPAAPAPVYQEHNLAFGLRQ
jgi:hypothetical protein